MTQKIRVSIRAFSKSKEAREFVKPSDKNKPHERLKRAATPLGHIFLGIKRG